MIYGYDKTEKKIIYYYYLLFIVINYFYISNRLQAMRKTSVTANRATNWPASTAVIMEAAASATAASAVRTAKETIRRICWRSPDVPATVHRPAASCPPSRHSTRRSTVPYTRARCRTTGPSRRTDPAGPPPQPPVT